MLVRKLSKGDNESEIYVIIGPNVIRGCNEIVSKLDCIIDIHKA